MSKLGDRFGDWANFDVSFELENMLETRGKKDLLSIVRNVSDMINVSCTRQKEALSR